MANFWLNVRQREFVIFIQGL